MDADIKFYVMHLEKNYAGATEEDFRVLQQELDFEIPNDYLDLMRDFNGGEGEIGENGW